MLCPLDRRGILATCMGVLTLHILADAKDVLHKAP